MNCLQGFNKKSSRDEHLDYCINNESVKVEMPHKKPIVQYSDGRFQFKVPFIMYAGSIHNVWVPFIMFGCSIHNVWVFS